MSRPSDEGDPLEDYRCTSGSMPKYWSKPKAPTTVPCPYCKGRAQLVGGDVIYPHRSDLFDKKFWQCQPCDAYVGCHRGTATPLGRLADAELRAAKQRAHAAFDPLWKSNYLHQPMNRDEAYAWLSQQLRLPAAQCHIGMFDVKLCQRVVDSVQKAYHERLQELVKDV